MSMSIRYRRLLGDPILWHFCPDCPDWPREEGTVGYLDSCVPQHQLLRGEPRNPHYTKPASGAVCDRCLAMWDDHSREAPASS